MRHSQPPEAATHAATINPPTYAPAERLIRISELLMITGCSRTQTYAEISSGLHPAPIKDGRASRWQLSQVQQYVAQKIARLPRKA